MGKHYDAMSSRERDAYGMGHIFKRPVKWFLCWRDPECGELQIQGVDPGEPDMSGFRGSTEPCYFPEDRDDSVRDDPIFWEVVPNYSTNASDDYEILKKVRTTWIFSKRQKFFKALESVWTRFVSGHSDRYVEVWPDRAGQYEPGDYLNATWLAKRLEEDKEQNDGKRGDGN